jgi:hypothetical protein
VPGAQHDDRGAPEGDEHRVEVGDREPGRRQREREADDAEQRQREPVQLGPAGGCRYRRRTDSVTRSFHDLE